MNVLSLFDGISCGQIALNRADIKYDNYYASEIDKHAIKVTQHNYPNTIQLGDVTKVSASNLPKINLLIGGSPCQGFSRAGQLLNFNDSRSKLFFEFVRLLEECKPDFFLLENVKMKQEFQDIISKHLGVEPIEINSNLVSAQYRRRLYWTNISNITPPENKGIILSDIKESGIKDMKVGKRGEDTENIKFIPLEKHNSKSGLICIGGLIKNTNKMWLNDGKILQRNFPQGNRVYSERGKAATLSASSGGIGGKTGLYEIDGIIRKLTPIECERLQTVPDNFTGGLSDNQRYKMLGNGWTVDVIVHILKGLQNETS